MTRMPEVEISVPRIYSLTGYSLDGLFEEVFLIHDENLHPNEFQAMVINSIGKLRQRPHFELITVHDVAKFLEKKFGFRRYSFYSCAVFDGERNVICEASIRG